MIGSVWEYLRWIVRPEGKPRVQFPRVDLLVMSFAVAGGVLLVVADIFQRWITPHRHQLLDIDAGGNIETWFHTLLLGAAAVFALGIAFTFFDNRRRGLWLIAGVGVAFFSMDKSVSLHETVGANVVSWLSLPHAADRIAWEITWAPLILIVTAALVLCVWEAGTTTRFWIAVAILGGAGKVALETMIYGLIHAGVTTEHGWLYGIEANIEESVQLMGFAAVCAAFSQYFVDRLFALARDEAAVGVEINELPAASMARGWAPVRTVERAFNRYRRPAAPTVRD